MVVVVKIGLYIYGLLCKESGKESLENHQLVRLPIGRGYIQNKGLFGDRQKSLSIRRYRYVLIGHALGAIGDTKRLLIGHLI